MFRSALLAATFATASLLAIAPAAAPAAASLTMPTCAAGDAVVWENTKSKVFHLSSDKYYGKTKNGAYACQSAAVAGGYHLAGTKKTSTGSAASATTPSDPNATPSPAPSGKHHHHHHGSASPSPAPAASAPAPAAT